MIRFAFICVLAFPVVVLGSLLAFVVFGPVDIPPGIALVIAVSIVAQTFRLWLFCRQRTV